MLAIAVLAIAPAASASCIDTAALETFNDCMQDEILPLESKVVHLVNALRSRYRADPERLKAFERAADAWNAERNGRCSAVAEGKKELEAKRSFAACTKRALEARVRELEAL